MTPKDFKYYPNFEGSGWIHEILVKYGYKIMHIMGDADGNVPLLYTKRWLKDKKWPITRPWTPFTTFDEEVLLGYT